MTLTNEEITAKAKRIIERATKASGYSPDVDPADLFDDSTVEVFEDSIGGQLAAIGRKYGQETFNRVEAEVDRLRGFRKSEG